MDILTTGDTSVLSALTDLQSHCTVLRTPRRLHRVYSAALITAAIVTPLDLWRDS
jgi:hypothetical protein